MFLTLTDPVQAFAQPAAVIEIVQRDPCAPAWRCLKLMPVPNPYTSSAQPA